MVPYTPEGMSEESEDEVAGGESHEEMTYRRKYQMLLERCEVLQQDNERLVNRIQHVYKYTRQARKERVFLIDRLEGYKDNWQQGINQYLLESLNRPTKPKTHPQKPPVEKKFRRPSSAKKPRQKDKDIAARRRTSKDGRSSSTHSEHRGVLMDIMKMEYESEQSSGAY